MDGGTPNGMKSRDLPRQVLRVADSQGTEAPAAPPYLFQRGSGKSGYALPEIQFVVRPATPRVDLETFFAASFGRNARTAFPAIHISELPSSFSSFCSCTW
jgi:hypothetical protein